MEELFFLCDNSDCGQVATAFGIRGSLKTRCCKYHMAKLLYQDMQLFDIEEYNFISRIEDAKVLEERKARVKKGRSKLADLKAACDLELANAVGAIESVKRNLIKSVESQFEEIKAAVTMNFEEVKRQLSELETEFKQFLSSKESQLSPTIEMLCTDSTLDLKFLEFNLADVSDSVSALLSDCWTISTPDLNSTLKRLDATQKKAAVESSLVDATEYAQKGISDALKFVDLLIGDDDSFDQAKHQVAELLKFEKEQFERNRKWLQRSWDLRQRCALSNAATIEVGQKFAAILYRQLGLLSEAEGVLKYCYDIAQSQGFLAEVSMPLCNAICDIYFNSARYDEAEMLGEWILDNFTSANLPSKNYWTTLLYLTYSKRRKSKNSEAIIVLEKWLKQNLREEDPLAEMLRLLTCGIAAYFDNREKDAKEMLLRAKRIGISHFPTSSYTALALFRLTFLSDRNSRERYHLLAQSIYEVAAPKSIHAAINLGNLGNFYKDAKRWKESEERYREAQSIYDITAPKSIDAANNLGNLGLLFKTIKRFSEAEEFYRKAQSIYEVAAEKSVHAANNLYNLGGLLKETKMWGEAEKCYRKAQSIYKAVAPKSVDAADNLFSMGMLYEARKDVPQAIDCFDNAAAIYAENGDTSAKSAAEKMISRIKKTVR